MKHSRSRLRIGTVPVCIGVMLGLLAGARPASARTCTWQGVAVGWMSASNWRDCSGGLQNGDIVQFDVTSPAFSPFNDFSDFQLTLGGIVIASTTNTNRSYDLVGNGIVVAGDISVTSGTDSTQLGPFIVVPIRLGADIQIHNVGPALLTLGDIDLNGHQLTLDASADIELRGVISDSVGTGGVTITRSGPEDFTVTIDKDNTYSGPTQVLFGTVATKVSHPFGLPGPQVVAALSPGTTLRFITDDQTIDAPLALANEVTVAVGSGFHETLAGSVNLAGSSVLSVIQSDAATLTLSGHATCPAGGTGCAISQLGPGTFVLADPTSAQNPWTSLSVNGGVVQIAAAGAFPSGADLTIPEGTFDMQNFDVSVGSLAGGRTAVMRLGSGTLTINQSLAGGGFAGTLVGTGSFVKNGPATLRLTSPNIAIHGPTTVNAGGLSLENPNSAILLGRLVVNGGTVTTPLAGGPNQFGPDIPVSVMAPGTIDLTQAVPTTFGSLLGTGSITHVNAPLTIGTGNASTTFRGTISGTAGFIKVGTGAFTFAGTANTPLTTLSSGGLDLGGAVSPEGTLQMTGGFLLGDGTAGRIVATGGTINPGDETGILHANGLSADGVTFDYTLNGATVGAGYGQLDLTDNLTLSPTTTLNVTLGFDPQKGDTFTIINVAAGKTVTGTFNSLPEGTVFPIGSRHFRISYSGGDGNDVMLTAVDNPPSITYYLSEGATGDFFDEDILIANPNTTDVPVTLTFSTQTGQQIVDTRTVPAQSRMTVHVDKIAGLAAMPGVSAQVTSTNGLPLVVERSMFWDASYYAGSTGSSVDKPAQDWFFAEGSQGFFYTFILINNPNSTPADVTFTFFLENGTTVTKTVTVGATTRLTLYAGDVPDLVNQSFGTTVHATQPIMAERSMYFGTRPDGRVWCGGTESAGVTATSTHWFLAEGATGGFFNTYVLLSNPNNAPANVTVQYLLPNGDTVTSPKTLPAHTRKTTNIGADEPDVRLKNTAVSTVVTSDQPIIAERSMYWPGAIVPFGEGHNSFGVTDAGLKWGLAEGRTGTPLNYHTYILLANPQTTAANVTVTYLRETGTPLTKTYTVPPTSRFNIDSATLTELHDEYFGALIEVTNNVPIIVERSLYWDSNGFPFSGGTNATAIPLP